MPTIYRKTPERITIADAKRLIIESVNPIESVSVFRDAKGKVKVTPSIYPTMQAAFIHEEFFKLLGQLNIEPRNIFRPSFSDYPGGDGNDEWYFIAHDEFLRIAETYGVIVQVENSSQMPQPTTPSPAPAKTAAPPAPVVTESASDAPATQGNIMKKVALIAELEYEWPSIVADLSDATRNGLKAAAHTGTHGEWDRDKARSWAVSKGKIKQTAPVHPIASAWPGATTRHTINR